MTKLVGVYGAGGCGRGLLPLARQQWADFVTVFVDDALRGETINGAAVLSWADFVEVDASSRSVILAIANSAVRQKLAERCGEHGIPLSSVRAGNVVEMDDVVIGEGACLSPFVTLTSNIRIGRSFHANLYSYVEHDCRVGDYVTLAPGAKINGNVTLHDHVYIGSGAMIRQGLTIGAGAFVGMGAVVTQDVPPGVTVVGNPARPLVKAK